MNSIFEKEKKLSFVLERLKNLNFKNPILDKNIQEFNDKKNQLEIEKKDLENKYNLLKEDYDLLSKQIKDIKDKKKLEDLKQIEFSEKIDELNQETDTLLEEIDKWQT
jgi:chromosome segregation ATPase|tara:strand:+ start:217 stop:540 length:324 start_codon:yes stop_codon:yes gene_type:complete